MNRTSGFAIPLELTMQGVGLNAFAEGFVEMITRNASETRELGKALARKLRPGDVLLLVGELGAGKTSFAQGLARGLGVRERVTSPTFALVREYAGRLPLIHLDAYRLEGPLDLYEIGVEEYLDGNGVLVVEWGDRVKGFFEPPYLEVKFEYGSGDDVRRVVFIPVGEGWRKRLSGM